MSILTILVLAAPALIILAAIYDVFTMTIPNWLSLALGGLFVVTVPFLGLDWWTIAMHLAAGASILAIGIAMFAAGWVGGGDVKLAAATCLWVGFSLMIEYFFIAAIFGGILTIFILLMRRLPLPATAQRVDWIERLHNPANGVPYGVALAFGAILVFPRTTPWIAVATM
ncbi:MAG: Tad secretion system prepilin peptidase TadV [Saliniramus fredricksonii]|uniref:Prepilin peptidase CpaA n=1 Tax=Saliniramus fredricksonii TaxID=1653334 RepID=A0A0P8A0I5_9HYPH|nr:prepilin peptidase [Saliniramus fredricksonii]KPQ10875.1 MAG: Tad secretion system prepilin peptidase TadV [Saliniramus fredricksonii]SCC81101.1 prepilin peptidase CpaA [Saliniramus fredricksonii]